MLDHATFRACRFSHVHRPLPSGFVTGSANGHTAKAHQFEFSFVEAAHFIGVLKALENHVGHNSLLHPEYGLEQWIKKNKDRDSHRGLFPLSASICGTELTDF